jgi:hypothetical protein
LANEKKQDNDTRDEMTVAEHNEYERKVAENRRKKDQI